MFSLHPVSRAALAACALSCFAAAYATIPAGARSAGEAAPPPPERPAPAHEVPVAIVEPRRDPFADARGAALPPPSAAVRPLLAGAQPVPLAPPPVPSLPPAPARVSAVVTGSHPVALVETGSTAALYGVGDRVDGTAIVAVTLDGVTLADGRTLPVRPAAAAPRALLTDAVTR